MMISLSRASCLKLLLVLSLTLCAIGQRPPQLAVAAAPSAIQTIPPPSLRALPGGHSILPQLNPDPIVPLPRSCPRVLQPGSTTLVPCCMVGVVYVDGVAVAGAQIEIQSAGGRVDTVLTEIYSTTATLPYYTLSLSNAPLMLSVGEIITVTAHYGSHERTLTHTVRSGGQRLDFVLSRNQALDLSVRRQIRGRAPEGKFSAPQGLARDARGLVYVVDAESANVQVFDHSGTFLRRWGSFGNLPGQLNIPSGIVVDRSNNVYIADTGNHRIQKFDSFGQWVGSFGSAGALAGQLNSPTALALGPQGQIYVADTGNNRIQQMWPNGSWATPWTTAGDDTLAGPTGVAVDGAGIVYVVEQQRHLIHKYASSGDWLGSLGGLGNVPGKLNYPWGLVARADGTLYVSDTGNNRIQIFPPAGEPTIWSESDWRGPYGIAVAPDGRVYVVDSGNYRVRLRNTEGQWSGWGSQGRGAGQLDGPAAVAAAADGTIYVADTRNDRVQKFDADGTWLALWGMPRSDHEEPGYPSGIAVSGDGLVYVADTAAHRVLQFSAEGVLLHSWGGSGTAPGKFFSPYGLAVDSAGAVYVADTGNQRVQKFDADGTWLASWGGEGTGPGQFRSPSNVASAPDGSVYVLDKGNRRVQHFTAEGLWLASWGSAGSGPGQLAGPDGLAVAADGNVYVADTLNNRLQVWSADGDWLASWGRGGSSLGQLDSPRGVAVTPTGTVIIADTLNQRVQLAQPMTYDLPHATIVHLSNKIVGYDDQLVVYGLGQDSDASDDIVAYRWSSSRQELPAGDGPSLSIAATNLLTGTHVLTLEVQDDEGAWSPPAPIEIYVEQPPANAWTMLLYLAGDYHDRGRLLAQMRRPLESLSASLPNADVRIVAQLDGPGSSDTTRWIIQPGAPGEPPLVRELALEEVDMANPAELAAFVRWGQSAFPAPRYYLAIAGLAQAANGMSGDASSPAGFDDPMTVAELSDALSSANIDPVDLLHLDMSSLATLEVAYELRDHAEILIASQYLTWGYFAYDDYAAALAPNAETAQVAHAIVDRYAALAAEDGHPYTLSALDLRRSDALLTALDELAAELTTLLNNGQLQRSVFEQLWAETQKLESDGDYLLGPDDVYVDLRDWARRLNLLLAEPELQEQIAVQVLQARLAVLLDQLTPAGYSLYSQAGSGSLGPRYANGGGVDLAGAGGLSIIYPADHRSELFKRYVRNELFELTSHSRWPDFLLAGVQLEPIGSGSLPSLMPPLEVGLPNRHELFLPVMVK